MLQAQSAAGNVTGKVSGSATEWQQHRLQMLNRFLTPMPR